MNRLLLFISLFCGFSSIAQETPYQVFEVDSAAEPRGGQATLNTFLDVNLRKPIEAETKGMGGRIVVSAVVEPNGSLSDVKVMNRLHPDYDQEAIRALSSFKAWKPAYKGGKPVRQQISIPVAFKAGVPFIYRNSNRINYYDSDKKPLADSTAGARYKQATPLDKNGFPTGDIIVYKRRGSNWDEEYRIPFAEEKNFQKGMPTPSTTTIGYQNGNKVWEGEVILLDKVGNIRSRSFYKNGIPTGTQTNYYSNGVVAQKKDETEEGFSVTSWYDNGQIKEIRFDKKPKPMTNPLPSFVSAYWDYAGRRLVNDGKGYVSYSESVQSKSDTARKTLFTEQGLYENGFKQGTWIGRYEDGSYYYEERFDKGIFQQGKALTAGRDTVRYTDQGSPPEFKGGMAGLGQFLAQNLRYPVNAQRSGVEGRVFVSFVVCEDGSLCDYEVFKGVHPDVDQEAIRVVKQMDGKWKPGTQRGQKVRVKYNLPINFHLH